MTVRALFSMGVNVLGGIYMKVMYVGVTTKCLQTRRDEYIYPT